MLPPCKETLKLNIAQANHVAKMWRLSWQSNTDLFNYSGCGCGQDFGVTIGWIHNPFPSKVYVFFDPVFGEDDYESRNECEKIGDDCQTHTQEYLKMVFV